MESRAGVGTRQGVTAVTMTSHTTHPALASWVPMD
jgi:hypothetical protein